MKKESGYVGENEKWLSINDYIVIERDGKPYLKRRTLISIGKWFSIKLHEILQSDGDCSHDHPWPFLTIILKGGYYEWTPVHQKDSGQYIDHKIGVDGIVEVCNYHPASSIMYRPAKWKHRLELCKTADLKSITHTKEIPAKTLVFTFKEIRDWGFFTTKGWIFWKDYDASKDC